MNYESIDRDMSCWVLWSRRAGTLLYISDNASETATDILANARRYRWRDQAEAVAIEMGRQFGWPWKPASVPAAMNRAARRTSERAEQANLEAGMNNEIEDLPALNPEWDEDV